VVVCLHAVPCVCVCVQVISRLRRGGTRDVRLV